MSLDRQEEERISRIYRERDASPNKSIYSGQQPEVHLQQFQLRRFFSEELLRKGVADLSDKTILDVGCGSGSWLGSLLDWGATPTNLYGIDLVDHRVNLAKSKYPLFHLQKANAANTSFENSFFDIITMNVVLSSVLSPQIRAAIAQEIARILKPSGIVLIYDFVFDNPSNANVCAIRKSEIARLFPSFEIESRSLTLAPPIARKLCRLSIPLAALLEWTMPFLRTHRLYCLKRR